MVIENVCLGTETIRTVCIGRFAARKQRILCNQRSTRAVAYTCVIVKVWRNLQVVHRIDFILEVTTHPVTIVIALIVVLCIFNAIDVLPRILQKVLRVSGADGIIAVVVKVITGIKRKFGAKLIFEV
ncbi:hypothetical protein D3C85_1384080 [compost metagenome]